MVGLGGCAPKPSPSVDDTEVADAEAAESSAVPISESVSEEEADAQAPEAADLAVREIKVVEDNGQHAVFAKLSVAPRDVSHFTLASPNRLVIELEGAGKSSPTAAQYPVDNPGIERIGIGSNEGRIRLTIALKGDQFPTYTVDVLNDTLVAFVGEPQGHAQPAREQVVFSERAVAGAPPPPAPVAKAPVAEAAAPTGRIERPAAPPLPPVLAEDAGDAKAAAAVAAESSEPAPFGEESEGLRVGRGRGHYYGPPVSLDLKEADIHNVLRLIAEVSKLNIVATNEVKGNVTLRLFDVPWDQALDIILQVSNLESVREGNVIRVSTVKKLREEREEAAKARAAKQVAEPLQTVYVRLDYIKAKNIASLLQSKQSSKGGGKGTAKTSDSGILSSRGTVMVDEFTNTVIVRDTEDGIRAATDMMRRLDVRIPQILIESNIVEANVDAEKDLGVQWGYRGIASPETGNPTGYNFPGRVVVGGSGLNSGTGGLPYLADFPAGGNFAAGAGSALDLALGSLDGTNTLVARITALEQKGKARLISRPRVVTVNNVAATIKSVTIIRVRMPSSGTTVSTGAGSSTGTSTATEEIETGITLTVTPQASSDGFVLLDMKAKSSQADFSRTVDNIPTEIKREANSHVMVRDGQTFVIGGIYRDQWTDTDSGIPYFRNVRGLSWLFGSSSSTKRREDLLVFITPKIVGAVRAFPGLPTAHELWQRRLQGRAG